MRTHSAAQTEHRQSQLAIFRIDDDVIRRVRALKPKLLQWAGEVMTEVFSADEAAPEVIDYYTLEQNEKELIDSLMAQANRVFDAQFDDAYYEAMEEIGRRHSRLDYPSYVYTAGYANLMCAVQKVAAQKRNRLSPEDMSAVVRITFFDMENMMAAFYRAKMSRGAAIEADAEKVRRMLAGDTAA